jgi:hypothetical protein
VPLDPGAAANYRRLLSKQHVDGWPLDPRWRK